MVGGGRTQDPKDKRNLVDLDRGKQLVLKSYCTCSFCKRTKQGEWKLEPPFWQETLAVELALSLASTERIKILASYPSHLRVISNMLSNILSTSLTLKFFDSVIPSNGSEWNCWGFNSKYQVSQFQRLKYYVNFKTLGKLSCSGFFVQMINHGFL